MGVGFDQLSIGQKVDRPFLAKLWGYRGHQAISRGVVTPANSNYIVLFVTEQKQESLTQYNDYLVDGLLHWEGQTKHGSDARIVQAQYGPDQIHLFHRKRHHSDFLYLGRIFLQQHHLRTDAPSQFIFYFASQAGVQEPSAEYSANSDEFDHKPLETEKAALRASRVGQGVFRDGLLRQWGRCAVTGLEVSKLLIASHIKPWSVANDVERLDPNNGLLLQPSLDKLFDLGFISFKDDGGMIATDTLEAQDFDKLGIDKQLGLSKVFDASKKYLEYHRDVQFGKNGAYRSYRLN